MIGKLLGRLPYAESIRSTYNDLSSRDKQIIKIALTCATLIAATIAANRYYFDPKRQEQELLKFCKEDLSWWEKRKDHESFLFKNLEEQQSAYQQLTDDFKDLNKKWDKFSEPVHELGFCSDTFTTFVDLKKAMNNIAAELDASPALEESTNVPESPQGDSLNDIPEYDIDPNHPQAEKLQTFRMNGIRFLEDLNKFPERQEAAYEQQAYATAFRKIEFCRKFESSSKDVSSLYAELPSVQDVLKMLSLYPPFFQETKNKISLFGDLCFYGRCPVRDLTERVRDLFQDGVC